MTKRKHDPHRRRIMGARALLRQQKIAVVAVDVGSERQGLIQWNSLKSVAPSHGLAWAICELPHHWTIYLAVFCRSPLGEQYIKAEEIAPQGQYKSIQLAGVMEQHHNALRDTCNPRHIIGTGWIASPVGESLTEEQAAKVFEAVGAWDQREEAA